VRTCPDTHPLLILSQTLAKSQMTLKLQLLAARELQSVAVKMALKIAPKVARVNVP